MRMMMELDYDGEYDEPSLYYLNNNVVILSESSKDGLLRVRSQIPGLQYTSQRSQSHSFRFQHLREGSGLARCTAVSNPACATHNSLSKNAPRTPRG
ncbi:hypothetical protein C8Q80DRAFT_1187559 [Daedaleopsis nitida]|nr:hypothetical protein C8Q80DRAFT_1187559 [Daedaleopsis nitida]